MPLCTTCPTSCQKLAVRKIKGDIETADGPCLEEYYGDGSYCDPACNNAQCNYDGGDCSLAEIRDKCVGEQQALVQALSGPPTGSKRTLLSSKKVRGKTNATSATGPEELLRARVTAEIFGSTADGDDASAPVPVGFQLQVLEPLSIAYDPQSMAVVVGGSIAYRMQWTDGRLLDAPCRDVLPDMLHVNPTTNKETMARVANHSKLLWTPQVAIKDATSVNVANYSLLINETLPWLGDEPAPKYADEAACPACAAAKSRLDFSMKVTAHSFLPFTFFPFDRHQVALAITVEGADLFSCSNALRTGADWHSTDGLNEEEWEALLLPQTTGEWLFDGHPVFKMAHDVAGGVGSCSLLIPIVRNWENFFIKQITVSVIVVYSGYLALFLHPAEHTGDRVANLMVAFLIIVVNFQTDIGIGKQPYLLWWDWFNMAQLALLLIALLETIFVHRMWIRANEETSAMTDRLTLYAINLGLYPVSILALIVMGLESNWHSPTGVCILIVGIVVVVSGSGLAVALWSRFKRRGRAQALRAIGRPSATTEEFRAAFKSFDYDNTAKIDVDILRHLIVARYPLMSENGMGIVVSHARSISDDGKLDFPLFLDVLRYVKDENLAKVTEGGLLEGPETKRKIGLSSRLTRQVAPT